MAERVVRYGNHWIAVTGSPDEVSKKLSIMDSNNEVVTTSAGLPVMSAPTVLQDGRVCLFVLTWEKIDG